MPLLGLLGQPWHLVFGRSPLFTFLCQFPLLRVDNELSTHDKGESQDPIGQEKLFFPILLSS